MNVTSMNSFSGMMPMQSQNSSQSKLTDEQKQTVNDILAEYDSSDISQQDFHEIFEQFQAAGISGGESLKSTTEAAGFDFSSNIQTTIESGEALPGGMGPPPGGPAGGNPPPPPPESAESSSSSEYSDLLAQLLEDYENGEADLTDFEALIENIKSTSFSSTGNIVNNQA